MDCKITLFNEVKCQIDGLSKTHYLYFYKKYAYFARDYYFNPKYQLKSWDGKVHYFSIKGETYIYILSELIPALSKIGYEVTIEDKRVPSTVFPEPIDANYFNYILDPETGEPWVFRDYQVEMINSMILNGGGIGIAGTGAGKTSMCAALAKSYEDAGKIKSIIIVPDTSLIIQTIEEYEIFKIDVGEYSGDVKDLNHQHVVSTWQALKNVPAVLNEFNMVIVDECQGLRGPILNNLLVKHGCNIQYRFGCTGTLPDNTSDEFAVKVSVGRVVYEIPAHHLIESGHLSDVHIHIIQHDISVKANYDKYVLECSQNGGDPKTYVSYKNNFFDGFTSEKRFLQTYKDRQQWLGVFLTNISSVDKGNVLCLVNGIDLGKKLAKIIPDAVFLYGNDEAKVRKEIYDKFATNNNLIIIATVNIAGTGLNIKRIFNLVLVDVGKSSIRVIQSIGRSLRKAHDKNSVNVYDICSDFKFSKRHLSKRIAYYSKEKYPFSKKKLKI